MKNCEKIQMLKDILSDKDVMSKKILKEEPEDELGVLQVSAEGESPEDAKEKMMAELEKTDLPDEEEMEELMPEEEDYPEEKDEQEEDEEELDEDMLEDEDREILDMLPEKSREAFKKRLFEKIKEM